MKKSEWLKRYRNRLTERGLNKQTAKDCANAVDEEGIDLDDSPESAADDELSYWAADS